ncbi:glycosyl transferase family 90 [Paracoccus sp. WLY502]|uniref:glycosyl transferase family 90 n=1 Tax=Paracoccus yibinensis TaxID=3068891 RepID=UPI002796C773|nr:glycosyl transferase family 90 [Paracoccus sp. WLY502]MDQ1901801.1 glycosyl transferase family 90 [Paracoccus sp. WLY502]
MARKFFQIGFNKCGTTFIARLFQMNGYPAVHWAEGALAEDIAWSKLTGAKPLQPWGDTVAFTDMESVRYLNMPIVEAFKEFRFLDDSHPGSVFLLNTRRVEDWVISRYMHRGGSYARAHAQIRGVAVADLADLWAAEWDAHLADCRAYFANRAEFVEIDIDHATPGDYRDALAPWFDLRTCPHRPGAGVRSRREGYLAGLSRMLAMPQSNDAPDSRSVTADIVRTALPARVAKEGTTPPAGALIDLDRGEVRDGQGGMLPIRRAPDGFFYAAPGSPRLLRIATTANDMAQAADRGSYFVETQPGFPGGTGPVLAPSRRAGAANVFLWPMPWIHRLGNDGYLGRPDRIDPPWAEKLDRAVFRGDLSGHVITRDGRPVRPLHRVVTDVLAGGSEADLTGATRVALALRHLGSTDVDAGLTPDARGARALDRVGLAHLIAVRKGDDFLLSHRYLICLGATSGSEDFLPLANSNSVVLLEEDGWETFARAIFQPWQHYIPLRPGAGDLAGKLAWARAHPDSCQQISARARALCALLADPQARRQQLGLILRDYRLMTGQRA